MQDQVEQLVKENIERKEENIERKEENIERKKDLDLQKRTFDQKFADITNEMNRGRDALLLRRCLDAARAWLSLKALGKKVHWGDVPPFINKTPWKDAFCMVISSTFTEEERMMIVDAATDSSFGIRIEGNISAHDFSVPDVLQAFSRLDPKKPETRSMQLLLLHLTVCYMLLTYSRLTLILTGCSYRIQAFQKTIKSHHPTA